MNRRSLIKTIPATLAAPLALSACSGASVLNAVTRSGGVRQVENVRYMKGLRGTLDLYVPETAGADTPVLVFVYGGSWDSGEKETYYFVGQSLAAEGFIVAIPDYRVYPEVVFPGFVEDVARATAFIARLAREGGEGVPAGRHPLFLMGHSAGAQIAALLSFDDRYLTAAGFSRDGIGAFVGLSGPYDFLPLEEERYRRIFPPALRDASQPVNFVDGSGPPAFLATGLADTTVDPENTRSLARRIEAAGGSAETAYYEGVDHSGTITGFATALPLGERRVREAVVSFLDRES